MNVRRILKLLPILALLCTATGCALLTGGVVGGTGFTVIAEPNGGHPPFESLLTATPYYNDQGEIYGTYIWETPAGTYSFAGKNTFISHVTGTEWEATCWWTDGNKESKPYTVRLGVNNTPPSIYPPLVNGQYRIFVRPGEETTLQWPVNKVLTQCAPADRRGIYDADGDDVRILCIQIQCYNKGQLDTIFTPPYEKNFDGTMEYHVQRMSGPFLENACLFYPGFTSPELDPWGRPYTLSGPLQGYAWDPCHSFGLGCDPMGDAVFVYICVEDEWGARNSAIFILALEDALYISENGITVDDHPFDNLDCCGFGDGDPECFDCWTDPNPWDNDPESPWSPRPGDNNGGRNDNDGPCWDCGG